jgi:2-polyprenyl-3-methyl-5-hydroxy-6-metoxy-1,4-benzoquinol methylase
MLPDLTLRSNQLELMDTLHFTKSEMEKTLEFLSITNKYFGGAHVVLRHLENWIGKKPNQELITILDIGCGGGEIPVAIAKWAKKKNFAIFILAIDLVPVIVEIARKNTRLFPNIHVEEKNFFDLVREEQKFDFVIASLFLHHTPPLETNAVLLGMDKLAKRGIIISDLQRSYPSYLAVSSCSLLLGNNIVRHDGPLSVRRSFQITMAHIFRYS